MHKLLISVAVAAATLAAVPAAAQHRGSDYSWNQRGPDRRAVQQLLVRIDQVDQRIDRSAQRGIISRREAYGLQRQATQIRQEIRIASRNGLSGREFGALNSRVNRLEQRLRVERRDRDGRRG